LEEQQYIVFRMNEEKYGAPLEQIQSIEKLMTITKAPKVLNFIKGLIDLRGTSVPVIDLRERFGLPTEIDEDQARIVIVNVADALVGMIVDAVLDVQPVMMSQIEAAPKLIGGVEAKYLNGVAHLDNGLLILLNLNRILSEAEERQLAEVEKSVRG
jgi:purine-binding chemotaxis protein CheW